MNLLRLRTIQDRFELRNGLIFNKKTRRFVGHKCGDREEVYIQNGVRIKAHRVIFALYHGFLPKEIDHIDRNPLNNHIDNLRAADRSTNNRNTKIRTDNRSGIKGLGFHKATKRWRGRIKVNGKVSFIQSSNKNEVIQWLKENRRKLHGDFARDF